MGAGSSPARFMPPAMLDCPECGGDSVTLDPDSGSILGDPIVSTIYHLDDGDEFNVTSFCWDCGWEETKTVFVEVAE